MSRRSARPPTVASTSSSRPSDYVYVIEIKTDSTPDEVLAQINEKGYARPFADDPRRIFKIGVNFSTANRRIDGWKVIL